MGVCSLYRTHVCRGSSVFRLCNLIKQFYCTGVSEADCVANCQIAAIERLQLLQVITSIGKTQTARELKTSTTLRANDIG